MCQVARMQPAQRRAAILDAAVAEISERGFARTTSRQIAARAGVTHGLLHHYFPDHDSLLAAAFEAVALEEIEEAEDALASDRDPLAQLREITEPYGPGGGEEAYRFWLEAWAEAGHSPKLQETSRRLSVAWHDLVVGVIERGIAAGVFVCDHPHETAWMVVALSDAYALQTQIGSGLESEEMNRVLWRLTERELGLAAGTLARPAPTDGSPAVRSIH
jgi:AcrR family transcriptional regulator